MTARLGAPALRLIPLVALCLLAAACTAASSGADEAPAVHLEPAFGGRVFAEPVELLAYPGGRFLVAEKPGRLLIVDADGGGEQVLLDLSGRVATGHEELGLLSVALEPGFEESGHLWTYYVAPEPLRSVVSRFTVSAGGVAVPASEVVALEVKQPYENHNGGALRFGPDGMLYLGLGDGGDAGDPHDHGQRLDTLLGSVLRLDVRELAPGREPVYAVPADNPFVGQEGAQEEIWAYGLRNPWRMAFDPERGALWAGDVGQDVAEEVNIVRAGGNHGWRCLEGEAAYGGCDAGEDVAPVAIYGHDAGCAIVGGVVYRGETIPALDGWYLFSDLCRGTLWGLPAPGEPAHVLAETAGAVVSFGLGHDGEVYILRFGAPALLLRGGEAAN